ncbi:MAG: lytic transglycosylase domain-containing protein [Deltaproteobacteria bacterium]|jgi:uncharacterized lipoprotein NlpE involved in copper resistance|nr:lytic transglycosylase domain-containing protein [Deltaproteobacteria bacterium]
MRGVNKPLALLVGFLTLNVASLPHATLAELAPVTVDCLKKASRRFEVPLELALGVLATEGGQVGRVNFNKTGTYDLGPMQINSTWLPILAELGVRPKDVRDNGCANVAIGVWILRLNYLETKDKEKALAYYHSRNPKKGRAYARVAKLRAKTSNLKKTLNKANALIGQNSSR